MAKTKATSTPNYGFNQIDCAQDPNMLFQDYVKKDSKENWKKADSVIKAIDDRVTQLENEPSSNVLLGEEEQDKFNFVKNDNKAICKLEVTKSGETNSYNFATIENHVEMSTGRTLHDEYMGVLKTMGEEFESADGSDITVENGLEARVIKGEISGRTVKNLATLTDKYYNFNGWSYSDDYVKGLKLGQTYYMVVDIKKQTTNGYIHVRGLNNKYITSAGLINNMSGIKVLTQNIQPNVTQDELDDYLNCKFMYYSDGVECEAKVLAFVESEEEANKIKCFLGSGLNSTQAIITNNGQEYKFYASEEDKNNKKVILLDSVADVKDCLKINQNGTVDVIKNTNKIVLSNGGAISQIEDIYFTTIPIPDLKANTNGASVKFISDRFNEIAFDNRFALKVGDVWQGTTSKNIYIAIKQGVKPTEKEVNEFIKGASIVYIMDTILTNDIDHMLTPAILTHNNNKISVGGAVKPSNYKLTLPVDKILDFEKRLQALESTTVDVILNK